MNFSKALIAIVIIGLAGAGFYVLSTKNNKPEPAPNLVVTGRQAEIPTDTPNPAAGSTVQTTDEWKTYTNKNSKVSFKYPTSAGMPDTAAPAEKTTATDTQVSVQTPGLNFDFIIQPIKPGFPKYYGDAKFQETYTAGSIVWDVAVNQAQSQVIFQTGKNDTQYVFVFPDTTEITELEQTIVSTFKF